MEKASETIKKRAEQIAFNGEASAAEYVYAVIEYLDKQQETKAQLLSSLRSSLTPDINYAG